MLVAHVKAAAGGGILRYAGGLEDYLFDRLIIAARKRLDRIVTDGRRNGSDRRIDRVQSLVECVRRRGDRIDRRGSWHRRRRRRRWARSRMRLFGLRFRFRLFLRCCDKHLGKLALRGCAGSKAERRSERRTAERAAARNTESKQRHRNSFLIAATNGQMAGSIAGRAVAADRKWWDCRVHLCAVAGCVRAARRQISNDRESGEGRRARLKCRTLRRDKNEIERAEMLDRSGRERNRQARRIRQE